MEEIISKFVFDNKDNGLMLLTSPTGSGKTYSVLLWAFHYLSSDEKKKKKIFFTTPLKKNLPQKEARQMFENNGMGEYYDKISLFLDSNSETVIDNFDSAIRLIPNNSKIKDKKEFKALKNEITNIKNMRGTNSSVYSKETKALVENNFREKTEPNFRRMVKEQLKKEGKTIKTRINIIKNDENWQWLAVLYPGVLIDEKQLIFVSWDKFILRNSSILEDSEYFFESKTVKDSIIFIDEFDSTKRKTLDRVVEEASKKTIEYVGLFKTIYSHIHQQKLHIDLLTESSKRKEGNYSKTVKQVFEESIRISEEINNKYHLNNVFKLEENSKNINQVFLFRDTDNITVSNSDSNNYIWLISDDDNNTNTIAFKSSNPKEEFSDIQKMLAEIKGFIHYFTVGISIIAENYMQLKAEKNPYEDEIPFESAVKTVISALYIDDEVYKDYLSSLAISNKATSKKKTKEDKLGISFHNSGFRFNAFNDDASHDVKTEIITTTFDDSPESKLLKFCRVSRVLGISATAQVPTVLGNYDLDYLKRQLGSKYFEMEKEDIARLRTNYKKSIEFYNQVKINAICINDVDKNIQTYETWKQVFRNSDKAMYYSKEVEKKIKSDFYRDRYFKFAKVMKNFLTNKSSYLFLYVCNMFPKKDEARFDLDFIKGMTADIAKDNDLDIDVNQVLQVLYSSDYSDNLSKIHQVFQENHKVFLISTYNTLGAGQNIQVQIPEELRNELVHINSYEQSDKMDFDSIYLENPTYLLKNAADIQDNLSLSQYLYQVEYLKNNYEISSNEAYGAISFAFKTMINGTNKETAPSFSDSNSSKRFLTLMVIQALGRICRTNMKCKEINIYYDSKMQGKMDCSFIDTDMSNPEMVKLIECIKADASNELYNDKLFRKAENKNKIANDHIHTLLNSGWDMTNQEEWRSLRDYALKNPTGELEIMNETIGYYYYFNVANPRKTINYKQNNDYGNIELFGGPKTRGYIEESEENSQLSILMKSEKLRKHFEENGWKTSWESNYCLMLPVFYNNIYKGALGEVCGKYFFETQNIELEDLSNTNDFEVFDYKVKGKQIYVDFKHWRESTVFSEQEMVNKIVNKARILSDCKVVFIINLLSSYETAYSKTIDDIKVIEIPSLLINKEEGLYINKEALKQIRKAYDDEQYND